MEKPTKDQQRLKDKTHLTLSVNYFSSALMLLFCGICLYGLHIEKIIPYVFLCFGLLNLINTVLYRWHRDIILTYNVASILALIGAVTVTLYSGGIGSPFIFVLALIVFAGYASTQRYGRVYLYLNLSIIVLIYFTGIDDTEFVVNVVPQESRNLFALLSICFSVYLLGGVFGRILLAAYHNLYKSKREIEQRINEKETLLKEIHHRVKNNLQTVSSLLSLQCRNIEDPNVKNLIKSNQNRVISMAMVHEMLYMREDLSKIEYRPYVHELSEYLVRSIKGADSNIKLNIEVPDIKLGIDTAIPLGLLINETITNALKYGFGEEGEGEINIALVEGQNSDFVLSIGDNGVGFPDNVNFKNTKSLGLKLINNLARQLKGTIMRDPSKRGTHYVLTFKDVGQTFPSIM